MLRRTKRRGTFPEVRSLYAVLITVTLICTLFLALHSSLSTRKKVTHKKKKLEGKRAYVWRAAAETSSALQTKTGRRTQTAREPRRSRPGQRRRSVIQNPRPTWGAAPARFRLPIRLRRLRNRHTQRCLRFESDAVPPSADSARVSPFLVRHGNHICGVETLSAVQFN